MPDSTFVVGDLSVEVHPSEAAVGQATSAFAAQTIIAAVRERGEARVILATGNSQLAFIHALAGQSVPWEAVTVFHMDEYIGIDAEHPAAFRRWIREKVADTMHPRAVEYIQPDLDDPAAECERYEALLRAAPIDLTCMGVGENGHLAFNEPGTADFDDPRWAGIISLTAESQRQQVDEGHFPDLDTVPRAAISLTVPALLAARTVQVVVPEARKAEAIARTLTGPINNDCPASILRRQPHARLFLDRESASLTDWSQAGVRADVS
ncbi:glucosamine-6-phosphate deaminase [Catenulispora sp. GAS73]|uniref:glucosamine-6-phosphate deaminase n=1 Tax=Catenulispora sp. GAS73 TaxID=3156269 RepID=UPI0035163C7C